MMNMLTSQKGIRIILIYTKIKLPYYQKPEMLASMMGGKYINPDIIISIKGKVFDSSTMNPIESSIEFIQINDDESKNRTRVLLIL
jgi:hypothetical protein